MRKRLRFVVEIDPRLTAEQEDVLRFLARSSIVSIKIYVPFENMIRVDIVFRRQKQELGHVNLTFVPEGDISSGDGYPNANVFS